MAFRVVGLPGTIFLAPSRNLEGSWARKARDHPHLPGGLQVVQQDLNAMTGYGGVPARIERPRSGGATAGRPRSGADPSLLVYGRTYALRLFPASSRSGYIIASVDPLRLSDHHRLAGASLQLRPARWEVAFELSRIPRGATAYWPQIQQEWAACEHDSDVPPAEGLSGAQAAFLDTVDRLIDADEQISTTKTAPSGTFPYRSVQPTGEKRYGRTPFYDFSFAGPVPDEGTFLQVRGEPGQRGQVTASTSSTAVIRFDQPVDFRHIPPSGELEPTPSTVVFRTRREAVASLREGTSHCPALLSVIVDHRTAGIHPASDRPSADLDEDQMKAFHAGLAVPDMLLVLGPPGTGKTRVISQIARSAAFGAPGARPPGRVLVTSHTHRAVDNVLGRLPAGLLAIRVGHEGKVTPEGQPYLIERQAAELREEIINRTSRALAGYAGISPARQWAHELAARAGRLSAAAGAQAQADTALAAARRAAGGAAQARLDRAAAEHTRGQQALARSSARITQLAQRRDRLRSRAGWPVLGFALGILAGRAGRRLAAAWDKERVLSVAQERRDAEMAAAERELDAATRGHPAVEEARTAARAAARQRAEYRAATVAAARACRDHLRPVEPPPVALDSAHPEDAERELAVFQPWLAERLPVLSARARLLADWHHDASGATEQLYPEFIRYADVVAATCIGAASRPELSDVDVDLAIVDEAGQIGVASALVPLARARRAILVGDHQQLPPYLDSQLKDWGAADGDPAVQDLLAKSVLELLVRELPDANVIPLTRQRRMPAAIAGFVSALFYNGKLETAVVREHRDLLFRSPLAFVDTAQLPPKERYEKSGRDREQWAQPGYTNQAEAALLTELADHYHRQGREWAVIVPYKAQVVKITEAVTRLIGNADLAGLNVGTVDSFQGGERDVILYGFTRSNPQGKVGFLDELRRANVAFTRARYQLVMVGDMGTLTSARDARFRDLAVSLRAYLAESGDLRPYRDVRHQLARLARAEGMP